MKFWLAIAGGAALAYVVTRATRERRARDPSEWLARVVIMEHAGAGPGREWSAIMQIALNRVASSEYPNTVREVVATRSWPGGGARGRAFVEAIQAPGSVGYRSEFGHRAPPDSSAWPYALEHARALLEGMFPNEIGSRVHFAHPGSRCDYEGGLSESGRKKCVGGRLWPLWSLPLDDPDSRAAQPPIQIDSAVFT